MVAGLDGGPSMGGFELLSSAVDRLEEEELEAAICITYEGNLLEAISGDTDEVFVPRLCKDREREERLIAKIIEKVVGADDVKVSIDGSTLKIIVGEKVIVAKERKVDAFECYIGKVIDSLDDKNSSKLANSPYIDTVEKVSKWREVRDGRSQ